MHWSKRHLAAGLTCLFTLAASADERVIHWATNPKYPPYDWSVGERYEGACVSLLERIIPAGYTLRPVMVPWIRAQKLAEEGAIDLLVNLRITPERAAWLEFSKNPTFPNPIAVFMRRDRAIPLRSWAELRSLLGGVAVGDSFGTAFDTYLKENLHIEAVTAPYNNLRKLDTGRIDYVVTGYYMGMTMISAAGMQQRIVALRPFITQQPIHLGFSRHSPHLGLLPEIDRRLAQLAADGTLEQILNEHLHDAGKIPISVFSN